jgi:RHS repeat-associated protein
MGCKRLNTDFFNFLEIVHSKKSAPEEKKCINYYPFGLEHKGYNNVVNGTEHKWKYQGKEHQQELGLDWYDFSARNYDPAIGRWMNIDPMGELLMSHSPFNYAFNNPVYFDDPTGMLPGLSPSQLYNLIEDINFLVDMSQSNFKLDEVVVSAETDINNNSEPTGVNSWGYRTGGMYWGRTGKASELSLGDLPTGSSSPSSGGAWVKFVKWLNGLFSRSEKLTDKIEKKPNESTMDDKVEEEAKDVPQEIKEYIVFTTYVQKVYSHSRELKSLTEVKKDSQKVVDNPRRSGNWESTKIFNMKNKNIQKFVDSIIDSNRNKK